LNKLFPLLAFSILLLVPVGAQNAFAGFPCPPGFTPNQVTGFCETPATETCPAGTTLNAGLCTATPACPAGTDPDILGGTFVCLGAPTQQCPAGTGPVGFECSGLAIGGVCPVGFTPSQAGPFLICTGPPDLSCPPEGSLQGAVCVFLACPLGTESQQIGGNPVCSAPSSLQCPEGTLNGLVPAAGPPQTFDYSVDLVSPLQLLGGTTKRIENTTAKSSLTN